MSPPEILKDTPALKETEGGRLAENIMYFSRILREAGLPVGPGKIIDALDSVRTVGISNRSDFYWTLHAVFVNRRDQRDLFDQAFHFFWRNPDLLDKAMALLLPSMKGEQPARKPDISTRLAEALANRPPLSEQEEAAKEDQFDIDASLTWSQNDVLARKDFEKMTNAEFAQARKAIQRLRLYLPPLETRRFKPGPNGQQVDLRATMRKITRHGGDMIRLDMRSQRKRNPPLVVLCDISGSMDRYARIMLHFIHALTNDRDRVYSFLFGTRLTNVTRTMRNKDPDVAIEQCSTLVEDWSGGTRIGATLQDFNRHWSRRVMAQNPIVLLISDGLDRDGGNGLAWEMERLHKSCRHLMWLNPLLRWDGYAPKASGASIMIRHIDSFRPIHNFDSLSQLADSLTSASFKQQRTMSWKELAI